MNPAASWLSVVLLGILLASSARAQPSGGPGGPGAPAFGGPPPAFGGPAGFGPGGGDKLMLLAQPAVQDVLKITDKQRKPIEQRLKKQRETLETVREMEPGDAHRKLAKQAKTNDGALSKLLTVEQYKRLTQISLQQRGLRALGDAEIAKALTLSGPQKKQIQQIQDDAQEEMREAFQSLGPPGGRPVAPGAGAPLPNGRGVAPPGAPDGQPTEAQQQAMRDAFKKIDALRQGTDKKLLAVLKAPQQTKLQEMQGEPFKGELMGRGPGGRQPGGDPPGGSDNP